LGTVKFLFDVLEEAVKGVSLSYDAKIEIVVPKDAVVDRLRALGSDFL
jgi:hypothetical protein